MGPAIAPFRRHQYGGAIGGPIKKDKTFFFSNCEGLTEAKGLSYSTDTLSATAHNGLLCANAACSSLTQIAIDPRMKPYLQFYPLPNAAVTGDTGKFTFPAVRLGDEKYIIGKIDHYFSSNTTLNGSYSWDDTTVTSPELYNEKPEGAPATSILANPHQQRSRWSDPFPCRQQHRVLRNYPGACRSLFGFHSGPPHRGLYRHRDLRHGHSEN